MIFGFWITDFGMKIRIAVFLQSKIQNPRSKIAACDYPDDVRERPEILSGDQMDDLQERFIANLASDFGRLDR
jgi:hypothetical protein